MEWRTCRPGGKGLCWNSETHYVLYLFEFAGRIKSKQIIAPNTMLEQDDLSRMLLCLAILSQNEVSKHM
jgi:hypothetical protein